MQREYSGPAWYWYFVGVSVLIAAYTWKFGPGAIDTP